MALIDAPKLWVPPKPAIIRAGDVPQNYHASCLRDKRVKDNHAFGVAPMFCPGKKPLPSYALAHTATYNAGSNVSTWTITNAQLSTAAASRYIVIVASRNGTTNPENFGVTIGGVSASRIGPAQSKTGRMGYFGLAYPTGTQANIVFTSPNAHRYWACYVFALYDLTTQAVYASASNPGTNTAGVPKSVNVNTLDGGIVIGVLTAANINNAWTAGVTSLGMLVQQPPSSIYLHAGIATNTPAASPRTVTATYTGSGSGSIFSVTSLSFR